MMLRGSTNSLRAKMIVLAHGLLLSVASTQAAPTLWSRQDEALVALLPQSGLASVPRNDSRIYSPPEACSDECKNLLETLKQCDNDSCICSQSGVSHFFEYVPLHPLLCGNSLAEIGCTCRCAICDTRLARKQGKYNAEETSEGRADITKI